MNDMAMHPFFLRHRWLEMLEWHQEQIELTVQDVEDATTQSDDDAGSRNSNEDIFEGVLQPPTFEIHNDNYAQAIGPALARNNRLNAVRLILGPQVTTRCSRPLVDNLRRSRIQCLGIKGRNQKNTDVILLLIMGLLPTNQVLHTLSIDFGLDDKCADLIGSLLLRNSTLRNLEVRISADMTEKGARRLALGFRRSTIQTLGLQADTEERYVAQILRHSSIDGAMNRGNEFVLQKQLNNEEGVIILGVALMQSVAAMLSSLLSLSSSQSPSSMQVESSTARYHSAIMQLDVGGNYSIRISNELQEIIFKNYCIQKWYSQHVIVGQLSTRPALEEMNFHIAWNKLGRYLLKSNLVPPGVWCYVLAKCNDTCIDVAYSFLRELPSLMFAAATL